MISVIVPTRDSAACLPVCLSALVPAAIDGLVSEVILADGGSTDATAEIAEDAGARLVLGDVATATADARSDWLLVLPPTVRLDGAWAAEAAAFLDRRGGAAACFTLAVEAAGPAARLREWLAGFGRKPEQGLLVRKDRLASPGPVQRLNARAFVP